MCLDEPHQVNVHAVDGIGATHDLTQVEDVQLVAHQLQQRPWKFWRFLRDGALWAVLCGWCFVGGALWAVLCGRCFVGGALWAVFCWWFVEVVVYVRW